MNDLKIETERVSYARPKNGYSPPQTPGLVALTHWRDPSEIELTLTARPDTGEDYWHIAKVYLSKRQMLELAAYLINAVKETEV